MGFGLLTLFLAILGFVPNDPVIYLPCLVLAGCCVVWLAYHHEGSRFTRAVVVAVLLAFLIFVGWRKGQQKGITGELMYCYINRSSPSEKTLVLVMAQIRNIGTIPTTVLNYNLEFVRPDSTRVRAAPLTPNRNVVPAAITDEMLKYAWLSLITQIKPLREGAVAVGFLSFSADADVSAISGNGTKCVLSFQDVSGKIYSIEGESKEGGGGQIPTIP
jgi:hypothetical protein